VARSKRLLELIGPCGAVLVEQGGLQAAEVPVVVQYLPGLDGVDRDQGRDDDQQADDGRKTGVSQAGQAGCICCGRFETTIGIW
jgi:hypothetical protein